jgi:subtilisin family serine protease
MTSRDRSSRATSVSLRAGTVLLVCLAALTLMAQQPPPQGPAPGAEDGAAVPGEYLIRFSSTLDVPMRRAILEGSGVTLVRSFDPLGIDHIRIQPGVDAGATVGALAADPDVLYVQPNYIRRVAQNPAPPNDPFWLNGTLYGMTKIKANLAWNNGYTGNGTVIIANIDTGVNYTHPDLAANMWTNPGEIPGNGIDDDGNGYIDDVFGIDTVNHDSNPTDDHGHGSHTSGTAGAVGNNGIGVVGVSWNVKTLACKFLNAQGNGTDAGAIECFNYILALKNRGENIRVSNNSWGGGRGAGPFPQALKDAMDAAGNAGILHICAAGNGNANIDVTPFDPASFTSPSIVAVASSDTNDQRASTSNYGVVSVDLAAPGVGIVSTVPGGYASSNGTSMATPHVAGAAALLSSVNPALTPDQLKSLLLGQVDVLPQWNGLVATGGRLNVYAALQAGSGNVPPTVSITSPSNGAVFTAPVDITLTAAAADIDGTIAQVAFYANGALVGTATNGSGTYSVVWTNAPPGTHTLTAAATDNNGAITVSAAVPITVRGTPGEAVFLGTDTTTRGSWKGVHGAQGQLIVNDSTSLPAYAQVAPTGHAAWTWVASTADVRALQKQASADRIAATWYAGTSFSVNLNILDGSTRKLAIYMIDWDAQQRTQRIDVLNGETQAVIDTRTVSGFTNGQYLIWQVTGHVVVRVTRLNGVNAVVSGLFFDSAVATTPPTVSLTSPTEGQVFSVPANITLAADASDSDGTVAQVAFYANGDLVGMDTTEPYSVVWTNAPAGSHTLTAIATDNDGATTTSSPVHITVQGPPGSATYVTTDTITQGTWKGHYGGQGHNVVNDSVAYPAYAQVTPSGHGAWTWAASTADTRALQKNAAADRIAATWYSTGASFSIGVNITDGSTRRLALYVVDWDSAQRSQRIDVRNAETQALLDTRTVSAFAGGQYLVWEVSGHITLQVVRINGPNAVVSGLFFDSTVVTDPPTVAMTSPTEGQVFNVPVNITLAADASDSDGTVAQVAFYANGSLVGTDTTEPYSVVWASAPAGSHTITAVATDNDGATATSNPVHITVEGPPGTAVFAGTDAVTQGNWKGLYGQQGHHVVNDSVAYPGYAQVTPSGQGSWTWVASTSDVRALQKNAAADRIAATWYTTGTTFSIDVNITDGSTRQVALYVIDWDSQQRTQRIDVRRGDTQALLDTRTVSAFSGGQYLVWRVSGHVTVQVTRLAGPNAVVSGLFFDAP